MKTIIIIAAFLFYMLQVSAQTFVSKVSSDICVKIDLTLEDNIAKIKRTVIDFDSKITSKLVNLPELFIDEENKIQIPEESVYWIIPFDPSLPAQKMAKMWCFGCMCTSGGGGTCVARAWNNVHYCDGVMCDCCQMMVYECEESPGYNKIAGGGVLVEANAVEIK